MAVFHDPKTTGGIVMVEKIGELFGWVIVFSYALTVLNYFVKLVNRKYSRQLAKHPEAKRLMGRVTPFVVKNHKIFGFITITGILVHFYIQFTRWGLVASGAVAASLMVLQVILGAYGAFINKKRKGLWFVTHRLIAAILFAAIVYHIIYVNINFG